MNIKGRFIFDEIPMREKELNRLILLSEFYTSFLKQLFLEIKKERKTSIKKIIDIGAGTGHSSILLKMIFPEADVTYFDISSELLSYAKKLAEKQEININFVKGDILNYKFSNKYDFVFSKFALKHIFDPELAVKNMIDILTQDGEICLIDKDVLSNIWYPYFPLYNTNYMKILNSYNSKINRGGDSNIGRKIKHLILKYNCNDVKVKIYPYQLTSQSNRMKIYRKLYIQVYENLVPQLVNHGPITYEQAKTDVNNLKLFLENTNNLAIVFDFVVRGVKK